MCCLSAAQLVNPYSRARTSCASESVICRLSGNTPRTRARASESPDSKALSSSFASFFCCEGSGRDGSERENGDDMGGLLRCGRRPHNRPEEGARKTSYQAEMGAALSADRRRPQRRSQKE